jgi:hypothetical protein
LASAFAFRPLEPTFYHPCRSTDGEVCSYEHNKSYSLELQEEYWPERSTPGNSVAQGAQEVRGNLSLTGGEVLPDGLRTSKMNEKHPCLPGF